MIGDPVHKSTVLVIDDEESMREGCRQILDEQGYRAEVASDGRQGLRLIKQFRPSVVLVDLRLPGMNGVEVLKRIREIDPSIVPIIIIGYGAIDSSVETMKLGAFDYLLKPFDDSRLLEVLAPSFSRATA